MDDILQVDNPDQAALLLQPMRLEMLRLLAEPRTCTELATSLRASVQQVNYHMRKLEQGGFVDRIRERRVRGTVESIYRARAATIWLSPRLVEVFGAERVREEMSLGYLLSLAEDLQLDVARIASQTEPVPALGLSAQIELEDDSRREEFLAEVQETFQALASKYGTVGDRSSGENQRFRLMLACYPAPGEPSDDLRRAPESQGAGVAKPRSKTQGN